jgi:hypothetical protein
VTAPVARRLYQVIRWSIILLPALLFVCALVVPRIPGGTGLFSDSPAPWYQPITSPLFLAALIYAYPITRFCLWLGSDDTFLSPIYYLVLFLYSGAWSFLLRTAFSFFERRS